MPKTEPFDREPEKYDRWYQRHRSVFEAEFKAIEAYIPSAATGLEIGAGSGRFSLALGIQVGIEPSLSLRVIAARRGLDIVAGVAELLPFDGACFDYALIVTAVSFLDDVLASFRECHRVLKPDGRLIIGFIDRLSPLGRRYRERKNRNDFYREAVFLSVDEITDYLKQAGFGYFQYRQTIFDDVENPNHPQPVSEGYGQGSFVVVAARKLK